MTTELPFQTLADLQTGGNLGFEEAVPFFQAHLDAFWAVALRKLGRARRTTVRPWPPPSSTRCPPARAIPATTARPNRLTACRANTVSWATSELAQVHERIGDMATGAVLSDELGTSRTVSGRAEDLRSGRGASAGLLRRQLGPVDRVSNLAGPAVAGRHRRGPVHGADADVAEPDPRGQGDRVRATAALRRGLLNGLSACTS